MKLFIPTSSLNFNNIMSCESISPFAFYRKRNFGYKTFEKVELNNFDNTLLLFESFPDFKIPKSELVNFPMVIEVDIDSDGLKKYGNGIWQMDRTIYLNPFNSYIYFLSAEYKNTVLSRSESSAETKLVNLYRNNIKVFQSKKKEFKIDSISDFQNLNNQEIESDNKKNKIKGFAYAYLIAANKSTSKENIQLKNLINKIINLSSAILNSVSGEGSDQQNKELKHLLKKINIYQYNDVEAYLEATIPNQYKKVWNKLYHHFGLRISNSYNFEELYHSLINKSKFQTSINELKNWSNQFVINRNVIKPKLEWKDIALAGNKLTQYEDSFIANIETRKMYQYLINEIFVSTDITESSISSEKSHLADEITRKIKSYIGNEKWKSHKANKYLNNLRRNIAGQEAFHINWNTGLISAIAAFLLKGEDFEKLNNFLISSEIEDGRLAFGFYGSICGFANLSRIFTSNFYSADINYLIRIYKTIFKQIHNIELFGELPKGEKPKVVIVKSKNIVGKKKEIHPNNLTEKFIQEIEEEVPDFLKIKKKEYRQFYRDEISRLFKGDVSSDFIKDLENIKPRYRTKTIWKKVIKYIKKKSKQTKTNESFQYTKYKQTSLSFENNDNKLFYKDSRAFEKISQLIPVSECKGVKEEIEWIQKVHQKNGYKRKNGSKVILEKHSNEEVIKHLKNNAISQSKLSKETIEIMIKELNRIYC